MWRMIRYFNSVETKRNIVIVGFPGMALVGKTVATHIINSLGAKLFAVVYGTKFPAQLIVNSEGVGEIYKVLIYYSKVNDSGVFIVTGDIQPINDSDQHSLAHFLVNKLRKYGIEEIIAAAAYVSDIIVRNRRVFVAGNNANVIKKYIDKGAVALSEGVISGLNGIIIGWAKIFNINGVCILGETWRSIVELSYIDFTAAKLILDLINSVWGLGIDTKDLEKKGRGVEKEVELVLKSFTQPKESAKEERKPPYYIT